jgi:hypothetical protein
MIVIKMLILHHLKVLNSNQKEKNVVEEVKLIFEKLINLKTLEPSILTFISVHKKRKNTCHINSHVSWTFKSNRFLNYT